MKLRALPLLALAAFTVHAQEPAATVLSFKTLGGETFEKATLSRVEPDGLVLETDSGLARVPLAQLPAELRARFGLDPAAAAAHAAKIAAQKAALAQAGDAAAAREAALQTASATAGAAPESAPAAPAQKAPSPASSAAAPREALPFPIEGHTFSLLELNRYRRALSGAVVSVRLEDLGGRLERLETGGFRVFLSSAPRGESRVDRGSVENYAFIDFPQESAQKLDVLRFGARGVMSFYLRVEPQRLVAVGRSKHVDSFKGTFAYTW